jgi:hypothetical protein
MPPLDPGGGGVAKKAAAVEKDAEKVPVQFMLEPRHVRALREAALDAQEEAGGRADASAVLRGVLDEWIKRKR